MLIFLDESFRTHPRSGVKFGVLSGIAIPEDAFAQMQAGVFRVRSPYHGIVLEADDELKGSQLLRNATFRTIEEQGFSYHWNLAGETVDFCRSRHFTVFGVVCFRSDIQSFVCADELKIDSTFRYLFERIDTFMKREFPGRHAKLIFDDRTRNANEKNARAITNFFMRSSIGLGYDSILRVPFFAVSQGHNYGLQLADLITTIIGMRFQGDMRIVPLWRKVYSMLYQAQIAGRRVSSLKLMKERIDPRPIPQK